MGLRGTGQARWRLKDLPLLCEAKSNPEIALKLALSERTVRNHASNLFKKLGVKSRAEAMLYLHGSGPR